MSINISRSEVAFVLVGGQGTRLRSLFPETPKPLVPLGGVAFLDRLLNKLAGAGFKHIFLLAGYLSEKFVPYDLKRIQNCTVHLVIEDRPLGSGGAVALGVEAMKNDLGSGDDAIIKDILIVNGDTWYGGDIGELLNSSYQSDYLLGVCHYEQADRYGLVELDKDRVIRSFHEKKVNSSGWVNSGYMVVANKILSTLTAESFSSLEKDVYPLFRGEACYLQGQFYDYGTPDSYRDINKMFWLEEARTFGKEFRNIIQDYLDGKMTTVECEKIASSLGSEQLIFVHELQRDPFLK